MTARFDDVADTALWVAAYRAIESERSDALFRDPLAARLAGDRGRELAKSAVGTKNFAWSIVVRTRVLDDWIQSLVANGVDAVVNLGAGMDTRPYRLELPPTLRWLEVDQPRIIQMKEAALVGETPRCALERLEADLSRREDRLAVLSRLSGNVLVLTEGVIGYLTNEAVAALALDLHGSAAKKWLVDYSSPMLKRAMRRRRRVRAQFRNAPFLFDASPDWKTFFANEGWNLASMRYLVEEGLRLGRAVPLPAWMRAATIFMSKARKDELRRMMGFGLLEKT